MEEKEMFDIFKFFEERKKMVYIGAFVLFLLVTEPSKASVFIGIIFCVIGEAVRTISLLDEGESDSLNTGGIYAYVRNPAYLGGFLIGTGIFVMGNTFILTALFIIIFLAVSIESIKVEEELLKDKYGEDFEDYAFNVPSMFPRLTPWDKKSKISFDLRLIELHKEYRVWLMIYAITIIMFMKIET